MWSLGRVSLEAPCPPDMSDKEYRQLQNVAVENHNGCPPWEVVAILLAAAGGLIVYKAAVSRWPLPAGPLSLILEFVAVVGPCALLLLPQYLLPVVVVEVWLTLLMVLLSRKEHNTKAIDLMLKGARKPFFSDVRSMFMVMVVAAILAVDFRAFPRRYAKTESYGYSMMDGGVGAFIIIGAIPAARNTTRGSALAAFKHALLAAVPLLVLGFGRLLSVKGIDYQEHVTEYGVHWNFFFTLAFVALFSAFLQTLLPPRALTATGVLLLLGQQYALSRLGLARFVLEAPRTDLLTANKEGLVSVPGYLGLYLVSMEIGRHMLSNRPLAAWWRFTFALAAAAAALFGIVAACEAAGEPPSRKMVNLPYAAYVLGMYCVLQAVFLLADLALVLGPVQVPLVDAVNRNQLFTFLLGNVLTGCTNMLMRTLCADTPTALTVVMAYTTVVCTVALLLHRKDITLKFW